MTTKRYKGYEIRIVGISHYIFYPEGNRFQSDSYFKHCQSMAESKRIINEDINGGSK